MKLIRYPLLALYLSTSYLAAGGNLSKPSTQKTYKGYRLLNFAEASDWYVDNNSLPAELRLYPENYYPVIYAYETPASPVLHALQKNELNNLKFLLENSSAAEEELLQATIYIIDPDFKLAISERLCNSNGYLLPTKKLMKLNPPLTSEELAPIHLETLGWRIREGLWGINDYYHKPELYTLLLSYIEKWICKGQMNPCLIIKSIESPKWHRDWGIDLIDLCFKYVPKEALTSKQLFKEFFSCLKMEVEKLEKLNQSSNVVKETVQKRLSCLLKVTFPLPFLSLPSIENSIDEEFQHSTLGRDIIDILQKNTPSTVVLNLRNREINGK